MTFVSPGEPGVLKTFLTIMAFNGRRMIWQIFGLATQENRLSNLFCKMGTLQVVNWINPT